MARYYRKVMPKGFTLIELLIVVAIIGVLSTIGVPTFRKMVTKAKKSEAKISLGGLYTLESAFYQEFNTFGNRLNRVGFEIDGKNNLYSVGFPAAAGGCNTTPAAGISPAGIALIGASWSTTNANDPLTYVLNRKGTGASELCAVATFPAAVAGTSVAAFTATATGAISPTALMNSPVTAGSAVVQDVWTMDQDRTLQNAVDGTN